jgi:hypothetical protein|tara:strand:- start:179 stop:499 length:321 start_codon:yes stop_codon:yes gene_type:complete
MQRKIEEPEGEKKFKEINPSTWKAENVDDSITGFLVSKEPGDAASSMSAKYHLDCDGDIVLVWGCKILDDKLKLVELGSLVRITYKGTDTNARKQEYKLYMVEVAE